MDGLALLDALAESFLKTDATRQLSIVSLVVVDEEEFWAGGGRWYLNYLLLGSAGASVEDVHKGLLFWRRYNNRTRSPYCVLGSYKNVVEVDLRIRYIASRDSLYVLGRCPVEVHVPGNLRCYAVPISAAHLTSPAAVTVR